MCPGCTSLGCAGCPEGRRASSLVSNTTRRIWRTISPSARSGRQPPRMAQEEGSMDRFNLGAYGRPISTRSAETQRWFDIGLNWCYGVNHAGGMQCFKKALESDPGCAMVHWGIAYAAGPFYNLTWKEHGDAEANSATRRCFEHVQLARANAAHASPVERRLIEPLAHRFQKPHRVTPQEFEQWDDAYSAELRPVSASFPDDD